MTRCPTSVRNALKATLYSKLTFNVTTASAGYAQLVECKKKSASQSKAFASGTRDKKSKLPLERLFFFRHLFSCVQRPLKRSPADYLRLLGGLRVKAGYMFCELRSRLVGAACLHENRTKPYCLYVKIQSKIYLLVEHFSSQSTADCVYVMINDLDTPADMWKYVDTSISETVGKGCESNLQRVVDDLSQQSSSEGFQLNEAKCKELRISFANSNSTFNPIKLNGKPLEEVTSAKLLGLNISSDLKWIVHVLELVKKASCRLYFLRQLKRSQVTPEELMLFYTHSFHP